MSATVILVAAGPGTRLGAKEPKAFVALGGAPLFIQTQRALLAAPCITGVVVVVPSRWIDRGRREVNRYGPWRCSVAVVEGGAERQDSVRAGLGATAANYVIIHDAARPFVAPDTVNRILAAAQSSGAAIVAVPATDTVKRVAAGGFIEETVPRKTLWLAQTPQAFRTVLLRAAHETARAEGFLATDDATLLERAGVSVRVVPGNPENRKITTALDLRWAEWWLSQRTGPR